LKVKVVRAILHEGKHQKIGTVLDLPDVLAKELVFLNKAEFVTAKTSVEAEDPKAKK